MAETKPQTYANHRRFDPPFHFFIAPVFVAGLIMSIVHFIANFLHNDWRENFHAFLLVVLAVACLMLVFMVRVYSLKVQDRVIRLEERLRLMQLMPEPLRSRIPELTLDQLIALRFASDAEVVQLAERAMNENLTRKQIKIAIQHWRPDYLRV
jgi:predicted PurR-regulated permease PerM